MSHGTYPHAVVIPPREESYDERCARMDRELKAREAQEPRRFNIWLVVIMLITLALEWWIFKLLAWSYVVHFFHWLRTTLS